MFFNQVRMYENKVILFTIAITILCLVPVIFGIIFIISGIRMHRGLKPVLESKESIWDNLFFPNNITSWLHGKHRDLEGKDYIIDGLYFIFISLFFYCFLILNDFIL